MTSNRILKAVSTTQLIIIIAVVVVAIGGIYFLTRGDTTPPVAILSASSTEVEWDTPIQFSAGDSTDNVGIVSYHWDFGDRTTGTNEEVSHTYSEAGNYTVTLTVTDKSGNEEKDTTIIEIKYSVPTLTPVSDANFYGDPKGYFCFPLIGDWTPIKADGSTALFSLEDPALELYAITVDTDDFEIGMDTALEKIGVDKSALSLLGSGINSNWNLYLYSPGDGQGLTILVRVQDGTTVVFILSGELSVTVSPPIEAFLSIDGFATLPLEEYMEILQAPPAPSTIHEIEDLGNVEFYSGGQKLVGRLLLPEGEGPFPAIVVTHGAGPQTRREYDGLPGFIDLPASGFAIFTYDKRGVGDSEGYYFGITEKGPETSEQRVPKLADDALAAVFFLQNLQEINPDQIGLICGSQAGWIGPLVAAQSSVPAYVVIVNGATVTVGEQFYYENLTGHALRLPQMNESEREELSEQLAGFDGLHGFDPRESIEEMSIPGLWIWGDRDGAVPTRESRAILEEIISKYDKDFTILYYPDMGHSWGLSYLSEAVDWIMAHLENGEGG